MEKIDSEIKGLNDKQALVDDALVKASEGVKLLEEVRDSFFKQDDEEKEEAKKPNFIERTWTAIKGFFGFSKEQMEDNPNMDNKDTAEDRKLIVDTLRRMEKMNKREREHFIMQEFLGL